MSKLYAWSCELHQGKAYGISNLDADNEVEAVQQIENQLRNSHVSWVPGDEQCFYRIFPAMIGAFPFPNIGTDPISYIGEYKINGSSDDPVKVPKKHWGWIYHLAHGRVFGTAHIDAHDQDEEVMVKEEICAKLRSSEEFLDCVKYALRAQECRGSEDLAAVVDAQDLDIFPIDQDGDCIVIGDYIE